MLKAEFGVDFTKYHVRQIASEAGYQYKKGKQDWAIGMKSERRQRQLLIHLLMLDQALKDVNAGITILMFTDQSFIDTCAHTREGYIKEGMPVRYPKGTGVRIAHMHALTEYGLLAVNAPEGQPIAPPSASDGVAGQRASEGAKTSELTFDLKKATSAAEKDEKPGFSAEVRECVGMVPCL